jgi:NADH:ubiquinone oxidoreductase subunit H
VLEFFKVNAKAVATFIVTALAQAVVDRINTGQALPDDLGGWGAFLGLSLIAAVVVWATGNKLDVSQILAGTNRADPGGQDCFDRAAEPGK